MNAQVRTIRLLILEGSPLDATIARWPLCVARELVSRDRLLVDDVVSVDGVRRIVRGRHLADDGSIVLLLF